MKQAGVFSYLLAHCARFRFLLSLRPIPVYRFCMEQNPHSNRPLAVGYMLLATVFIASVNLLVKALGQGTFGPPLHPLQVSHGRYLFAFIAISLVVAALRPQFTAPHLGLHAVRTTAGWAGVTLMFAAIAFIPLSDATAISFLNPVFAMMLAIPLLGERVGPVRWGAAAVALVGAITLLRPGAGSFEPAALLALGAAVVLGFEITAIKRLAGLEGPLQILFTNNLMGVIIATVAVVMVWVPPTTEQWVALAGVGVLMAGAQSCFVNSMRRAEASFVAPFSYATLVNVTLLDFVVFGAVPDWISLLGAAIIVAGAALLVWREGHLNKSRL